MGGLTADRRASLETRVLRAWMFHLCRAGSGGRFENTIKYLSGVPFGGLFRCPGTGLKGSKYTFCDASCEILTFPNIKRYVYSGECANKAVKKRRFSPIVFLRYVS